MLQRTAHLTVYILLVAIAVMQIACGERLEDRAIEESRSPNARMDILEALRQDLESARHSSDGGGRAWLEPEGGVPAVAAGSGRWAMVFEAGPEGIAEGGWLFLQVPPFWGWSTPQVTSPEGPGYTTIETEAVGLELEPATIDLQLLAIRMRNRRLEPGERVSIVYGAGSAGAVADRYAEARSCFYLAVDGDGDGVRALIDDPPCVEVIAGPAARLSIFLPSTAHPGERVRSTVAILDAVGNRVSSWAGSVSLKAPSGVKLPASVSFETADEGAASVEIEVLEEGEYRLEARSSDGLWIESNPMLVATGEPRILWADLHGHSGLSDGTGTPADYFRYARDVAALDIVALTDHDHWGMEPLALHPELWEEIRRENELFHRPGRFVTLLGYEWTSWIHGHRHVLFFADRGEILSSVDPAYESPQQLWDALRGREALTFAHHSAGGPVATNWEYAPDPELEPVTEMVSVHGSSEALDTPARIYSPIVGNFVRDVLDRGYRLGFVGSGDGHDGHPGMAYLNGASGGLAGILSEELSRGAVLDALRARRSYATNGPRILVNVELDGLPMGSIIEVQETTQPTRRVHLLELNLLATVPVERVEVIRQDGLETLEACAGLRSCRFEHQLYVGGSEDYLYIRVVQQDGGAAWTSPFFFR